MKTLTSIDSVRDAINGAKQQGKTTAFVPTMGNLHAGHISLIEEAKKQADCVMASVFVNPMQFGAGEDLDSYPRTLQEDINKLTAAGCDFLFTPTEAIMYPAGQSHHTQIKVPELTSRLCGADRPGHFAGVCTVVSKLFNIVQPDSAFFGKKDFQQLAVIRKMVFDLNIPVSIYAVETKRETDGLALSSRNQYLSAEERLIAPNLYQVLMQTKQAILAGNSNYTTLCAEGIKTLQSAGFTPGYLDILDAKTLNPINGNTFEGVIAVAASIGNTRLIDNVTFLLNGSSN